MRVVYGRMMLHEQVGILKCCARLRGIGDNDEINVWAKHNAVFICARIEVANENSCIREVWKDNTTAEPLEKGAFDRTDECVIVAQVFWHAVAVCLAKKSKALIVWEEQIIKSLIISESCFDEFGGGFFPAVRAHALGIFECRECLFGVGVRVELKSVIYKRRFAHGLRVAVEENSRINGRCLRAYAANVLGAAKRLPFFFAIAGKAVGDFDYGAICVFINKGCTRAANVGSSTHSPAAAWARCFKLLRC